MIQRPIKRSASVQLPQPDILAVSKNTRFERGSAQRAPDDSMHNE